MRTTRPSVLALLVAGIVILAPTILAPLASAADNHSVVPVSFTLTPAQCPALSVTVSGSTVYRIVTNTHTNPDGSTHMIVNSLATGTATDNVGGTYHFTYHNHGSQDVPAAGFPVQMRFNDHFNLEGTGSASGLHVGFVSVVTITDPTQPPTVTFVNTRGNPNCDPI